MKRVPITKDFQIRRKMLRFGSVNKKFYLLFERISNLAFIAYFLTLPTKTDKILHSVIIVPPNNIRNWIFLGKQRST